MWLMNKMRLQYMADLKKMMINLMNKTIKIIKINGVIILIRQYYLSYFTI